MLEKENKKLLNNLKYYKTKGKILNDKDLENESDCKFSKDKLLNDGNEDDEITQILIKIKNTLLLLKLYEKQNLKSKIQKRLKNLLVKKEKEY